MRPRRRRNKRPHRLVFFFWGKPFPFADSAANPRRAAFFVAVFVAILRVWSSDDIRIRRRFHKEEESWKKRKAPLPLSLSLIISRNLTFPLNLQPRQLPQSLLLPLNLQPRRPLLLPLNLQPRWLPQSLLLPQPPPNPLPPLSLPLLRPRWLRRPPQFL